MPAVLYGLLAEQPYRCAAAQLVLGSRAQDVLALALLPVLVAAGHRSRGAVLRAPAVAGAAVLPRHSYVTHLIGWPTD